MLCALCLDEHREGTNAFGGGVLLCEAHADLCREGARKSTPPRTVVLGSRSIEDEMLRLALAGTPISLADVARPAGRQ